MSQTASPSSHPLAAVTGASSGIGLEFAKEFARNGYDLLIVAESADLEVAARDIRALGAGVQTITADLTTEDGVERYAQAIAQDGRPLDAIAINAGIGVSGPFRDTDLRDDLRVVDLNCRSTVQLAKRAVQMMSAQGHGRILFTSSIAALTPGPFESVYGASKAFVYSFSQALRNELKDTGVTVTALMPGPTDTDFFERAGMQDTKLGAGPKDDPALVARQGYEALMAGKDHLIAGSLKTKVRGTISGIVPDTVGAEMHRKESEPGSATSA